MDVRDCAFGDYAVRAYAFRPKAVGGAPERMDARKAPLSAGECGEYAEGGRLRQGTSKVDRCVASAAALQ